jgi:peptidoglycan/xylan/chitin deacetylase (PgdA/CDA1 family)
VKYYLLLSLSFFILAIPLLAEDHFVVLQYHQFGSDTPVSTSVTLEQFDRQLTYLEQNGFVVRSFQESLARLQTGQPIPDKSVVLTMDDAYASIYHHAFPRLKQKKWTFTVFVSTEAIDQRHPDFMSWNQLREMKAAGVEFGSHSHTHPYLVRERQRRMFADWSAWVRNEIQFSRRRLKEELTIDSRLFAYPYGEYNLELKEIVAELGLIGVGQHSGVIWSGSDWLALPRFPVSGIYAEIGDFSQKVHALPLPVLEEEPTEPVLTDGTNRPVLRLRLADGAYRPDSIHCFASQQGEIGVKWIDRTKRQLEVVPKQSIPLGRSKYNCTAVQEGSDRFFWFSRQWLRLK